MRQQARRLYLYVRLFARQHPELWAFIATTFIVAVALLLTLKIDALHDLASYNSQGQQTFQGIVCLYAAAICAFTYSLMVPTPHKMRLDYMFIGFVFALGWLFTKAGTAVLWGVGGQLWGTLGFLGVALFGTGIVVQSLRERLAPEPENPWRTIDRQDAYIRELEAQLGIPHHDVEPVTP